MAVDKPELYIYISITRQDKFFKFRLPVTPGSIRSSPSVFAGPRKYGGSRWNFVAILSESWDMSNEYYRLAAAILEFWLPVMSDNDSDKSIE